MPDMVFRDPYILDFLNLSDSYSERDLETAILRDIEAFLLEMGTGFSFVARQKRMVIDGETIPLTCSSIIAACGDWSRSNCYVARHITALLWRGQLCGVQQSGQPCSLRFSI
jgi:hypothetical protein